MCSCQSLHYLVIFFINPICQYYNKSTHYAHSNASIFCLSLQRFYKILQHKSKSGSLCWSIKTQISNRDLNLCSSMHTNLVCDRSNAAFWLANVLLPLLMYVARSWKTAVPWAQKPCLIVIEKALRLALLWSMNYHKRQSSQFVQVCDLQKLMQKLAMTFRIHGSD